MNLSTMVVLNHPKWCKWMQTIQIWC